MSSFLMSQLESQQSVRMIDVGGASAPEAPRDFKATGVREENLSGMCMKFALTVQHFTTEWMTEQLCLPRGMVTRMLEELNSERLLEILGQSDSSGYRFTISGHGRERVAHLMEITGYMGPAPVSLAAYTSLLDSQFKNFKEVTSRETDSALSELVLPEEAKQIIGLALMSGRSLFVHGPSGSGKTSVGRMLHDALEGCLWIPHCIEVENSIIRMFDPQSHKVRPLDLSSEEARRVDHRWIRIERPFIMAGGELTIDSLDLGFNPALKYYEAPLHLKANGGTFLLDDFGRQRVEPEQLLNRWILPLERQIDFMTLRSGQMVQVPLQQMLVMSTSMNPDEVVDPAFMRRLGYRVYLGHPSRERYTKIFERYAAKYEIAVPPRLLDRLLARYAAEERQLRSCEPRDLIERARDICRYQDMPMKLDDEILDLAWTGYFGVRRVSV